MKKIILTALSIAILFSFSSCAMTSNIKESELLERIEQLEKENKDLKNQISELETATNPINDNTDNGSESIIDDGPSTVVLNKPFDVGEIMNITLSSSEWCEEILPSNTSGVYSYVKDVEGEKYFLVRGELKNLAGEVLDITYSGEVEYLINDKYKQEGRMELEEAEGNSFFGNAKPLQTLPLIIYTSVSDELYENCNTIKITMNLLTDESKVGSFYDEDYQHETFSISFNNPDE